MLCTLIGGCKTNIAKIEITIKYKIKPEFFIQITLNK